MAKLNLKLKERWIDIKTGRVQQSIVTEETVHIDDDLDFEAMKEYYIAARIGSSEHDGIRHEVSVVGDGLSKSEMFDFILNNAVSIDPDNTVWTKYNEDGTEEQFKKKYTVSINGHGMSGYDLEDAINYYVKEFQK